MKRKVDNSRGFTLIEVLLALVVAGIGILAMIQLSGVFLQTASESDQRGVATTLAERTLEELRGFDALPASVAGAMSFESISSSSNAVTVSSGLGTYDFTVAWDVTDFVASGASFSQSSAGPLYNMYKDVTVTVSWTEPQPGSVELSSIIAGIDPNASAFSLDDAALGGQEPDVSHNAGVAPDVIPIKVGNSKFKETSKPLPDVSQHGTSTRVDFEVVTYETDINGDVKEVREEFSTINCQCEYGDGAGSLTGSGETPTYYEWNPSLQTRVAKKGITTSKIVGNNNLNEQDDLCDRCCRDHHDSLSDVSSAGERSLSYDPWRPASGGYISSPVASKYDHKHFDTTGMIEVVPTVGDTYIEACRFKRIDGILYLMQDWRLIDINVMKRDELSTSTAISNYGSYVQQVIAEYIDSTDSNTPSNSWTVEGYYTASGSRPTVDFFTENPQLSETITVTPGSTTQLMARSIYLDEMSQDHREYIQSVVSAAGYSTASAALAAGNYDWLVSIPFYEINTTLLSDWDTETPAVDDPGDNIRVTFDPIVTIVDPDNNYYGSYSRGAVTAGNTAASRAVISDSRLSNTSLTGSLPIDLDDLDEELSAQVNMVIDTSGNYVTFSGFFDCVAINPVNGNNAKCSGTDYTGITISMVPATGTSCAPVSAPQGNNRAVFSCTYTGGTSWNGEIRFAHSDASFGFDEAADSAPDNTAGSVTWTATPVPGWIVVSADASANMNVEVVQQP